jgi:hypothetical protein
MEDEGVAWNRSAVRGCELQVTTSWDDGASVDLRLSALLDKYSLKGTFYVPKTCSYPRRLLSSDDVRSLDESHEIGAHTLHHLALSEVSAEEAVEEITGSKSYLEDLLGHDVRMFCYPNGRYNLNVVRMVKNAGFIGARTAKAARIGAICDPFEWPITVHASNGSPFQTLRTWRLNEIPLRSIIDWEIRAKLLFDRALGTGGVYHLWGHSSEIDANNDWAKLGRVFSYIANRDGVKYLPNGECVKLAGVGSAPIPLRVFQSGPTVHLPISLHGRRE